ncbi:signal transduction histidine kinase [Photobacterium aphoticum]|uniref:Signal transduction histidine kinase n=1 Tax=Photobacterium aphoticum TaxID=754436 RepID=A0A090QMY0_9GAMM|nr:signal transduction histidine kinase [Photobacterium aphoticum]
MANYESEKLQETLLDLMRTKERENQLREENTAILAGMAAMAGANNKRQVFNGLLSVLRKYIGFEHALVLTREDETAPLQELVTTCRFLNPAFGPLVIPLFVPCMAKVLRCSIPNRFTNSNLCHLNSSNIVALCY